MISFNPTHITKDKLFLIEMEEIDPAKSKHRYTEEESKNKTITKLKVYNTNTEALSVKSVYMHKDRYYITGKKDWSYKQVKYYLDELEKI